MGKIVVVTVNKDGKVELTKEELEKILEEAYESGHNDACRNYWYITTHPYTYSVGNGTGDVHPYKYEVTC